MSGNCDVNFSFTSFSSTPQEVVLTGTPNTWAWDERLRLLLRLPFDGKAVKWSQKIDGKWYYFDGQCRMKTGWVTWSADGTKSYFQPGEDGKAAALTGWHEIDGEWYRTSTLPTVSACDGVRKLTETGSILMVSLRW